MKMFPNRWLDIGLLELEEEVSTPPTPLSLCIYFSPSSVHFLAFGVYTSTLHYLIATFISVFSSMPPSVYDI
jgi:hypothetical protein